jgi:DNA polymerase
VKIVRPPKATVDFETRSLSDVKRVGAWLYSRHKSTQALCFSYKLPGWSDVKRWHRAHPKIGIVETAPPEELFEWIANGGLVEAHNAFFEMCIWQNVMEPQHDWPSVPFEQWRCSAAKAAAHALPRSLEGAIEALGLKVLKDSAAGKAFINRYSKPRKPSKIESELWTIEELAELGDAFHEDADGLARGWDYCDQDVRAEEALSEELEEFSPEELKLWQITNDMNLRGIRIDTELAESALTLAAEARKRLNTELNAITGITSGTKRAEVKAWLDENEFITLPDSTAKTIEWYLTRQQLTPRSRRVMEILKEVNRTSPAKFKRMLECVDTDDHARENLVFNGAERTGRFSGKLIQIHNLPKGRLPKGISMDIACEDVKSGDYDWCAAVYGDVMNLIVSTLRGAIVADEGHDLMSADYSAIEARCVLWEAGADEALEVFRRGEDIYCDMASGIYGYKITKATAKVINSLGATQRDFGKVAILGLGYGMGFIKFLITLRTYNIYLTRDEVREMMGAERLAKYEGIVRKKLFPQQRDFVTGAGTPRQKYDAKKHQTACREASKAKRALTDEREEPLAVLHELALCKYTVETYRKRYQEVPAMWKAQEEAAIRAVQNPGKVIICGVVKWFVKGRFLKCKLPSGRCLNYCDPHIKQEKDQWGKVKPGLRFWGINQLTKKWTRQSTYGGKLTENITQAIARDIMGHAKLTLAEQHREYALLISVHDQILASVAEGVGDKKEFERIMATLPAIYDGCPITAEAERYKRFRK